jgi:three-Cys-motif partner protein
MTLLRARDGYGARELTDWGREKLFYIESYLDIFCTAMKGKWSLVYADLLAGPGLCVDLDTGEEQEGSPLLALKRAEFQRLFINDLSSEATMALAARTASIEPGRLRIMTADCNQAVTAARDILFPPGTASTTLGLAVIDPTAFQISYEAIARLTKDVKLDLIIIYMVGTARRFIGEPVMEAKLDRFFGTSEWRSLVTERYKGEKITYRKLLDLYEQQLEKLEYRYVNDWASMKNSKNVTLYHMVFASKHPRGKEFFGKISDKTYTGQRRLW